MPAILLGLYYTAFSDDRPFDPSMLVVSEVYRQQRAMYQAKTHTVADRIVSLSQPHVRPIVRGKAAAPVAFGAKLSVARVGQCAYLDRLIPDAYHEAGNLPRQVAAYRRRFGRYPATVHACAGYRTREHRRFCTEHGTRLGAPHSAGRRSIRREPNSARRETTSVRASRSKVCSAAGRRATHYPGS